MQTTNLENVDFYVDEDFAVVYIETITPPLTPQVEMKREVTSVALELFPNEPDTIKPQKALEGRLQQIESKPSPAFFPQTDPSSSTILSMSVKPPEAVNSMDREPFCSKENTPEPLLEETEEKKGVKKRNCCAFLECFFHKKGVISAKKI